ncbi:hypothetical protein L218DRAFT_333907 [Marasmius fiardii PR-910]|nr:hypothetical protein L218DRAFT_333907 [Marasmius fiardii PR-910]
MAVAWSSFLFSPSFLWFFQTSGPPMASATVDGESSFELISRTAPVRAREGPFYLATASKANITSDARRVSFDLTLTRSLSVTSLFHSRCQSLQNLPFKLHQKILKRRNLKTPTKKKQVLQRGIPLKMEKRMRVMNCQKKTFNYAQN